MHGLVPLRALKSKMTSGRGMVVPFRVLSRKIWEEVNVSQRILIVSKCIVLELVPLRGKKLFGPRPQNRILVPFRGSFQNFPMITPITY